MTGKIYTDEIARPGYVWYRCADYHLPDNTKGKIGYHVVYRPLHAEGPLSVRYEGWEAVTAQMIADTRAYYAAEDAAKEHAAAAQRAEERAAYQVPRRRLARNWIGSMRGCAGSLMPLMRAAMATCCNTTGTRPLGERSWRDTEINEPRTGGVYRRRYDARPGAGGNFQTEAPARAVWPRIDRTG